MFLVAPKENRKRLCRSGVSREPGNAARLAKIFTIRSLLQAGVPVPSQPEAASITRPELVRGQARSYREIGSLSGQQHHAMICHSPSKTEGCENRCTISIWAHEALIFRKNQKILFSQTCAMELSWIPHLPCFTSVVPDDVFSNYDTASEARRRL